MKAIYIHGLGSDSNDPLLRTVADKLALEPVFVDYSSIYDKPGWPEEVLTVVSDQIPKDEEHVFITHSFGGVLAAYLQNKNTRAIVFIAPAFSVNMGLRFTLLAEAARRGHAYFESRRGVWLTTEDMNTMFRLMKNSPASTVPFVVIVGEEDLIIDLNAARHYFHRSNERRSWFVEIAGTGHLFVERENEVAEIVRAFVDQVRRWTQ